MRTRSRTEKSGRVTWSAMSLALLVGLSCNWAKASLKDNSQPLRNVLDLGGYVDPRSGQVDSSKYLRDLRSLRGAPLDQKLDALGALGLRGDMVWNNRGDGKPESNFDRAFTYAAKGIRSEDSNCVTTHAVLMFTAAKALGLEPLAISGLWNNGGGAGLHTSLLVRDPSTGDFYATNYGSIHKIPVDRTQSLNAQTAEASRLAQARLGAGIAVQVGDSAVNTTKLGDLLSQRVLDAQPGVAIEMLGDGSQVTVLRQGNLIVAKVGTLDEGDLSFAGYATNLGRLKIQTGLAWTENGPAPSETFVAGQFCYQTSRQLSDRVKIEGLAKLVYQINTHWAANSGPGATGVPVFGARAEDRGGARVDALTQVVPGTINVFEPKLPTRTALSIGGQTTTSSGLRFENRGGFFFASPNEIDRTSGAVFGASSRTRWNQGRLTLGADLNYLSQGQGTRSAGLAYSLGASYQLKKNQELTFRLAGGTGPSDDPFNLENFIRPEYRRSSQPRFEFGYKTKW